MKFTREDIIRMVEEEDVEFIRLQFTDIFGTMKNIAITASQLEKALDNKCMFDGSSIEGFVRVEESDMYLHPDLDTFTIFPWRPQQGKVARLICDVYRPDGTPFEGDSRYILKKVIKEAADMGCQFDVGPECEFFLYHLDDNGQPTTITHEKAGYFDLGPVDLGENARRDMVMTLEDVGIGVEASHHEVAPAQHEIDLKYGDALAMADNLMTFKQAVKTIAKRHGLHASFMPKPKQNINGSGMHINMSLSRDGVNIFANPENEKELSKEARYFMGLFGKFFCYCIYFIRGSYNYYFCPRFHQTFCHTVSQTSGTTCYNCFSSCQICKISHHASSVNLDILICNRLHCYVSYIIIYKLFWQYTFFIIFLIFIIYFYILYPPVILLQSISSCASFLRSGRRKTTVHRQIVLRLYGIFVTVQNPLFREVFWHEYAKIPRHSRQNAITKGDFIEFWLRICEGTEQIRNISFYISKDSNSMLP